MGKLIAIGQGQVVLTLCKASQGVNIINGVVNVLIDVDEDNNKATLSNGMVIDTNSVIFEELNIIIRAISSGSKDVLNKIIPLKYQQWKYAINDIYRNVNIEVVETDTDEKIISKITSNVSYNNVNNPILKVNKPKVKDKVKTKERTKVKDEIKEGTKVKDEIKEVTKVTE